MTIVAHLSIAWLVMGFATFILACAFQGFPTRGERLTAVGLVTLAWPIVLCVLAVTEKRLRRRRDR